MLWGHKVNKEAVHLATNYTPHQPAGVKMATERRITTNY